MSLEGFRAQRLPGDLRQHLAGRAQSSLSVYVGSQPVQQWMEVSLTDRIIQPRHLLAGCRKQLGRSQGAEGIGGK